MNFKRYLLATIALFAFIFLYELALHDFILTGIYEETVNVWRKLADIEANSPLVLLYQFALAAWSAFAFTQLYKEGGIKNGLLFGLFFGVFAGILTSSWYLWLPVPAKLAWSWFFSSLGEGLGGGFILGSIYRKS